MPLVELDQARLHYEIEGPQGAPVVLFSHSLGADLHMWDEQIPALTERFRVLRYDTRGHGASTGRGHSIAVLGGDAIALMDRLQLERVHVCGVSLGGMTALWLGIDSPHRIASVMACNTAARIGTHDGWNDRIEQIAGAGLASIADATMTRWFTESFRERSPARVAAMRQTFVHTDPVGYTACCVALREADLTAAISSISVPLLSIAGTYDPVTTPADGRIIAKAAAGAVYRELAAAHISNVEAAEEFNGAILDFLERQAVGRLDA